MMKKTNGVSKNGMFGEIDLSVSAQNKFKFTILVENFYQTKDF